MSSSLTKPSSMYLARNFGLGVLTFLGMRTMYLYVEDAVSQDPFAKLKAAASTGIEDSVGVRLQNVELKSYKRGKLVSSAQADRTDISKDRQFFKLTGIHNGLFWQDGSAYHYSADSGIWRANVQQLAMYGRARIQNADLDLQTKLPDTQSIEFNQNLHSIRVLQPVTGRLYKGKIQALAFHYDTETKEYGTGPVEYQGDLASLQKDGDDNSAENKPWKVAGDSMKASPDMRYYVRGRAEDDEMIIKADLVAQNLKTDVIIATGSVKYFSAKADITADKATVYHKERRIVLVGHVTILVKPKSDKDKPPAEESTPTYQRIGPEQMVAGALDSARKTGTPSPALPTPKDGKNTIPPPGNLDSKPGGTTADAKALTQASGAAKPTANGAVQKKDTTPQTPESKKLDDDLRSGKTIRQYPMVIVCDQVEYWYRKGQRHGHVTGAPEARQDLPAGRWRYVWSTTADYDAEKDELTLVSSKGKLDLRLKNSKGDDLTALDLTVSTKEDSDEEVYRGHKVTGTVLSDSDEDTSLGTKKGPPADKGKGGPDANKQGSSTKTGGTI